MRLLLLLSALLTALSGLSFAPAAAEPARSSVVAPAVATTTARIPVRPIQNVSRSVGPGPSAQSRPAVFAPELVARYANRRRE